MTHYEWVMSKLSKKTFFVRQFKSLWTSELSSDYCCYCTLLWTHLYVDIHSFIHSEASQVSVVGPGDGGFCIHRFQQLLCGGCRGHKAEAWAEVLGEVWLRLWSRMSLEGLPVVLLGLSELLCLCVFTTSPLSKDLDIVGRNQSCSLPINAGQQPASHPGLLLWTQDRTGTITTLQNKSKYIWEISIQM